MNIQLMISGTVACLLAWCILAVAPACAQTITHVPQFTIMGNSAGELFGSSISGAGDVNGDGFADLIVGAPRDDNSGDSSGSARVLSGFDGSVLYTFDGDSDADTFGDAVSGAGDVNGDGIPDFFVSGSRQLGGLQGGGNGYVRVFVSQVIILGDCNQDGEVTFLDIAPFIEILSANSFLDQADCNQDGVVNSWTSLGSLKFSLATRARKFLSSG